MADVDVIVVGAGVAGLSAASALRAAGKRCVVLEAASRIGGRAWTTMLGAAPFDHGAGWLHEADRNPLVEIARAQGETLIDSDAQRQRRIYVGDRVADAAELAALAAAWDRLEEIGVRRTGPDVSFRAAIAPMWSDPWAETIEMWEARLIAAADPADFSFADFRLNELNGRNMSLPGGIGDFVARRLGPMAGTVETDTPVTRIEWGGLVRAHTPRWVVAGRSCIVTESTGVLAAGAIDFDPPFPVAVREAIDALPMGLLTKVALRATGADRLDLPDSMSVQRRVQGRAEMFFNAWSRGHDHISGFIGGPAAWTLAREGEKATMAFAQERLRELFGTRADRAVTPVLATAWADDQWHRGAYAYARTGHVDARGVLGTPLAEGRLIFAGEAVRMDGLAGTVGGAWLSGQAAAAAS